jgi:hypothetical protein
MKSALLKVATTIVAAALLAGCAGVRAHRGAVLDPELTAGIRQAGAAASLKAAATAGAR